MLPPGNRFQINYIYAHVYYQVCVVYMNIGYIYIKL